MLPLDLGVCQGLGQAEAGRLIGEGPVLAEPALDLAGGGGEAGGMMSGGRDPMDGDSPIGAERERLGRGLGLSVEQQRIDLADGVLGGRLAVGRGDDEGLAGAADAGAGSDDVESGPIAIGGKEPGRPSIRVLGLTGLLGQAGRRERAPDAESVILGDRAVARRTRGVAGPSRSPRSALREPPRRSGPGR